MLSWALAFFIVAVIAAIFGFASPLCGPGKYAQVPPQGWACPDGWACSPKLPLPAPHDFACPQGWTCAPVTPEACGAGEIGKILFVVFTVLFLVSLVAGLLRRS